MFFVALCVCKHRSTKSVDSMNVCFRNVVHILNLMLNVGNSCGLYHICACVCLNNTYFYLRTKQFYTCITLIAMAMSSFVKLLSEVALVITPSSDSFLALGALHRAGSTPKRVRAWVNEAMSEEVQMYPNCVTRRVLIRRKFLIALTRLFSASLKLFWFPNMVHLLN